MTDLSFSQFSDQIQEHFAKGTFAEGLSLASLYISEFPNEFPLINYWRMCLAARLDETVTANKILESTLASGIWYSEILLRQSPALEPLQGQEEFERLIDISLQMQTADPINAVPVLVVRPEEACGPEDEGCPAVIFLHANQDTAQKNLEHWRSLPNQGWLVAMPQSSLAMWAGVYIWQDFESAAKEIEEHYHKLTEQYSLDPERILLAGFSMGAEVALAMILDGRIKAKGFVLLGPGGPFMGNLDEWSPLIEKSKSKDIRGVILMGLADETIPQDNIRQLVKTLNDNGIACDLKTFPGLENEYPEDFEDVLKEALDFIF